MMELQRICDRCPGHRGPCDCGHGQVAPDQRYTAGALKGHLIPDDVWSLEQLTELGAGRRYSARVANEWDEPADITVDRRDDTISFGES